MLLDHLIPFLEQRPNDPLTIPWPSPGNPAGFLSFSTVTEWRDFVLTFNLSRGVPEIVATKFKRAQKLFFLGWIDADLIKAGELVAFTALELALKDRYGNRSLAHLLKHIVEKDGLTDDKIPMVRRCGGNVVSHLTRPTGNANPILSDNRNSCLSDIRNSLAHGDPFDACLWSGLFELIRDLIDYAYRDFVRTQAPPAHTTAPAYRVG
jgi:hypothetical protein